MFLGDSILFYLGLRIFSPGYVGDNILPPGGMGDNILPPGGVGPPAAGHGAGARPGPGHLPPLRTLQGRTSAGEGPAREQEAVNK